MGGGANAFGAGGGAGIGTGGGVDPAFASAPVNPMNLPTSAIGPMNGMTAPAVSQGPSPFSQFRSNLGKYANALQPLANQIPGMQQTEQGQGPGQQQQRPPVNFNIPSQPYIPAPGAGSSNLYGY